ncbi:MAG: molybdopterin-guanine dinucleotide biosynthesis protein B [Rhodospirillales bacterium]|nr:molybdopterin-guanine dinucleotide biosynthesis protein B [Alphaproteobacteria bacterium]MBL6947587.1 molybdopterin-guanine dinucleotide biosynthesis protein B [Rhodospirillales bacterium]
MKIFGLVGWSGSGKTTLVSGLLPELIGRGLTVSTMKHTHHNFDIDKKGKDSFEHRMAGATEVLITGSSRWAILHENRDAPEPSIDDLLARMEDVDLVLIEGFKSHNHQKMEIYRPAVGKPLLAAEDQSIVAVASDAKAADLPGLAGRGVPLISLNDIKAIADFIIGHTGLESGVHDGAA